MKRDFDLMRKILFKLEEGSGVWGCFKGVIPENKILLHLRLLEDIGCVALDDDYTARLTFKGYDIIELIRVNWEVPIGHLKSIGMPDEFINNYTIAEKMKEKPDL